MLTSRKLAKLRMLVIIDSMMMGALCGVFTVIVFISAQLEHHGELENCYSQRVHYENVTCEYLK